MASLYRRGNHIYFRVKNVDGEWNSVRSQYVRGQEKAAQRALDLLGAHDSAKAENGLADGPLTVRKWAELWIERRKAHVIDWRGDQAKLRDHVLPAIGEHEFNAIRPRHIDDLVQGLRARGEIKVKTIKNIYSVMKAMFRDAKIQDLFFQDNPCCLTKYQIGEEEDDGEWRAQAIFTRAERVQLIFDERIPLDRRVYYALESIAGLRLGEAAALRWKHLDLNMPPLGRMIVAVSHARKGTKAGSMRQVPIHPVLADLLKAWWGSGWAALIGRAPVSDDLVVPLPPADAAARRDPDVEPRRGKTYCYKRITRDLEILEWRHRRGHDLRRTMVSLARADGARKDILETITHNPKRATIDLYTSHTWEVLCEEIAKCKILVTAGSPNPPNSLRHPAPFATAFATEKKISQSSRALTLWRRRVLPPP